ncbi:WD repeat-containing protein 6-like isoform X1 [Aphis craccivora]|uniref:WD repeat-containing protein 6-like isoform X1 n=1 Tax=Aphis craccivora TaxID=307492 RepID=A0A6G0Z5F5_APHCR|nr:WD repeat-containing protein 6-like isoform X1 [Aphis craccivora]
MFSREEVKVIVYGQGVETFYADMSSLTQSPTTPTSSMQVPMNDVPPPPPGCGLINTTV